MIIFKIFVGILTAIISFIATILAKKHANKKRNAIIIYILSLLTTLSTIILIAFPQSKLTDEEKSKIITEAENNIIAKNPDRFYIESTSNSTDEFTKQSALSSLTKILNAAYDKDNPDNAETRFNRITENPSKFKENLKPEVYEKIHASDIFAVEGYYSNTSLTLLSVVNEIANREQDKIIKVKIKDLNQIFLDEATKSAYIPLDVYTERQHATSFQMVYVNNEWKLSPHSLLQSVELTSILKEQQTQQNQ